MKGPALFVPCPLVVLLLSRTYARVVFGAPPVTTTIVIPDVQVAAVNAVGFGPYGAASAAVVTPENAAEEEEEQGEYCMSDTAIVVITKKEKAIHEEEVACECECECETPALYTIKPKWGEKGGVKGFHPPE